MFRRLGMAAAALSLGCVDSSKGMDSANPEDSGLVVDTGDTGGTGGTEGPVDGDLADVALVEPRVREGVTHLTLHTFTTDDSLERTQFIVANLKNEVLGDKDADTCFEGANGERVQFGVQTEFTINEYLELGHDGAMSVLTERLETMLDAGLAVDLLLPVHYRPEVEGWQGVDWQERHTEHWFMPYAPAETADTPYDVMAEYYQGPIIEALVANGLADRLSSVIIANEFGYWGADLDAEERAALLATQQRLLTTAEVFADGRVPIGAKFVNVQDSGTGWTDPDGATDPLAELISGMADSGQIFYYDAYFDGDGVYDPLNAARLEPLRSQLAYEQFRLGEVGRLCDEDSRDYMTEVDHPGLYEAYTADGVPPSGINTFAWNAGNCYGMTVDNWIPIEGSETVIAGMWATVENITGTSRDELEVCE